MANMERGLLVRILVYPQQEGSIDFAGRWSFLPLTNKSTDHQKAIARADQVPLQKFLRGDK